MARWIRRTLFALLILTILHASAWLVLALRSGALVERELEAIRSRGEPILLEEMAPEQIPDDENAAVAILQAMNALRPATKEEKGAMDRLRGDPFGSVEAAAALVDRWVGGNATALEHLQEAARRPSCRFDVANGSSADVAGVKVVPLLGCGEVVVSRALLRARAGATEAAFRDLGLALQLAGRTGMEPVLIHLMVQMVVEERVLDGMEHILARHRPSEAAGEVLRRELARAADRKAHRRVVLGERCFGISSFESGPGDVELSMSRPGLAARLFPRPARRLDEARYLRLTARLLQLASRPYHEAKDDWAVLTAEAREEPWYGDLTRFAVIGSAEFWATGEAHRTRLAMAAHSLDDAPPPIDPFTGEPIAVSRVDDEILEARSPGPDRASSDDDVKFRWRAR